MLRGIRGKKAVAGEPSLALHRARHQKENKKTRRGQGFVANQKKGEEGK